LAGDEHSAVPGERYHRAGVPGARDLRESRRTTRDHFRRMALVAFWRQVAIRYPEASCLRPTWVQGHHPDPPRGVARILPWGLLEVLSGGLAGEVGGHHPLPVPWHQQVFERVIEFGKERPLGQGVDREQETATAGELAE